MDDLRFGDRTIEEMLDGAVIGVGEAAVRQADGWRKPLATGRGFRHRYSSDIGDGGWDFFYLCDALSIAVVDFRAARPVSRFHRHDDHLVFSAVIEGRSAISDRAASGDELAHGFCTFYGLDRNVPVSTVYEPGRQLRWISIFLRCDKAHELCGFDPLGLPAIFRDFICHGKPTGLQHVPLEADASMAATQILECSHHGEMRRMFLIAKAIEIIVSVVRSYTYRDRPAQLRQPFTRADAAKIRIAKEIIAENLDDPLNVAELANAVELTPQKLQYGFQAILGSSVARVYKQVRLARAMSLVSESTMPMIEIALECGYEHPASFTRAFKQAFGASPSIVRLSSSHFGLS